jgi:hypothetical protein
MRDFYLLYTIGLVRCITNGKLILLLCNYRIAE